MTSIGAVSGSCKRGKRRALSGLSLVLALTIAVPEEMQAAPMASMTLVKPSFARTDSPRPEVAHCCHVHPLPPYTADCCHAGGGGM